MSGTLDATFRSASARIIGALAARYRNLDLAEEAFAEACARAAEAWRAAMPERPDGWLYAVAQRCALDLIRKRRVRDLLRAEGPEIEPSADEMMLDDSRLIPDERLRLIFVCCHPAIGPDARAALTLRTVCGLSTGEIAHAFLTSEATLAQRLVRAKRKIAEAGVPFEIPGPNLWAERLDAVLSTLEVAYSKAHEDAAGAGLHSAYAAEMLNLSQMLAELLPDEADVLAFAALVRFCEARRPARTDAAGSMIPLSEQNPAKWNRALIRDGDAYLKRGFERQPSGARLLQARIHAAWCRRQSLDEPPPWPKVLALYDSLVAIADNPITRLNRIVALAEIHGYDAALEELDRLHSVALEGFLPFRAVRADLLRKAGRTAEARIDYDAALALQPAPAESLWLTRQRNEMPQ
jgi:RNA polymerase sigma-70 factor (ECF subfamily)